MTNISNSYFKYNVTDAGNYSCDHIEYDILNFYSRNKPQKAEFTK